MLGLRSRSKLRAEAMARSTLPPPDPALFLWGTGCAPGLARPELRDRACLPPEDVISLPRYTRPLIVNPGLGLHLQPGDWLNLQREAMVTASPQGSNKEKCEIRDKCNYLITLLSVAEKDTGQAGDSCPCPSILESLTGPPSSGECPGPGAIIRGWEVSEVEAGGVPTWAKHPFGFCPCVLPWPWGPTQCLWAELERNPGKAEIVSTL